jgi:hypothetical protein
MPEELRQPHAPGSRNETLIYERLAQEPQLVRPAQSDDHVLEARPTRAGPPEMPARACRRARARARTTASPPTEPSEAGATSRRAGAAGRAPAHASGRSCACGSARRPHRRSGGADAYRPPRRSRGRGAEGRQLRFVNRAARYRRGCPPSHDAGSRAPCGRSHERFLSVCCLPYGPGYLLVGEGMFWFGSTYVVGVVCALLAVAASVMFAVIFALAWVAFFIFAWITK